MTAPTDPREHGSPRRAWSDSPEVGVGGSPVVATAQTPHTVVDVVVPVYNEETDLGPSVRRLHAYLDLHLPVAYRITIADNASTDRTWEIAEDLASTLPHVSAVRLEEKGRGRALHQVWSIAR